MKEGKMKTIKWTTQPGGSLAWIDGDHTFAEVYPVNGFWRARWPSSDYQGTCLLPAEFPCANDACLAVEQNWRPPIMFRDQWLESKNGGYFRRSGRTTFYVRRVPQGWYAVRTDGKVLGRGGDVSWFATAEQACGAVQKVLYTPVDADPFVDTRDQWRWIKVRNTAAAA